MANTPTSPAKTQTKPTTGTVNKNIKPTTGTINEGPPPLPPNVTQQELNELNHDPIGTTGAVWSKLTEAQKLNALAHTPASGTGQAWSKLNLGQQITDYQNLQHPGTVAAKPAAGTGIAAAPTNTGFTSTQQNAWDLLQQTLAQYGFSGQQLQQISAWARTEIINGSSADQITLDMQTTPWFKQRFPGIELRKQAGLTPITPATYLSLEDSYTQILRQSGLPQNFYNTPEDFANLIGADVSPTELQDRITNAYDVVNTAPLAVQQAFHNFYGPQGQSALAAYVIDPTRAEPALLKQVQAAENSGIGAQFGFQVDKGTAEQMAALGIDNTQATTGFKQAENFQSLIHGGINETNPLGGKGVTTGEFDLTPNAGFLLNQAVAQKQAAFQGGGGANQTATGITGIGKANPI